MILPSFATIKCGVGRTPQKPPFRNFNAEIEALERTYSWFRKGDNRFSYFSGNSFIHGSLFDAFDEGAATLGAYIETTDIQIRERALMKKYAADRDAKYRRKMRAARVPIRAAIRG